MNGRVLILNDNTVRLTLSRDGAPATATVTMELQDAEGNLVSGQVWPSAMTLEGAGTYVGGLQDTLDLEPGETYYLEITAQMPGGIQYHSRNRLEAMYRT